MSGFLKKPKNPSPFLLNSMSLFDSIIFTHKSAWAEHTDSQLNLCPPTSPVMLLSQPENQGSQWGGVASRTKGFWGLSNKWLSNFSGMKLQQGAMIIPAWLGIAQFNKHKCVFRPSQVPETRAGQMKQKQKTKENSSTKQGRQQRV